MNSQNKLPAEKFKLQFITNQWSKHAIEKQVRKVLAGGCRWIQLRLKDVAYKDWLATAEEIRNICQNNDAVSIINDNVEIALKLNADGVHLGKEDMDPVKARQLLGRDKIIGGTANTLEEVLELYEKGVDYIGLGPFRETQTKNKLAPVLGLEGYERIISELRKRNVETPVVAIGGIKTDDIQSLLNTEIDGLAISSLIAQSNDPSDTTKLIFEKIKYQTAHVKNNR